MDAEEGEFDRRQSQLQASGRLAAEIAHQVKNPLGIINNAVFALGQAAGENKSLQSQVNLVARNSRAIIFDRDLEGVITPVTCLDVDFAIPSQRFSCIL